MSYSWGNGEYMYQPGMPSFAGGRTPRRFDEFYRCYPIAMMPGPERESANHGGKVFLPASALEKLTRLHIAYPMLFELINGEKEKQTHAGVLEFTAEEGKIYLPYWIMQTLLLEIGDLIQIKSTDLPAGTFIKLQPQSPAFLDISDPKAVLENAFRNFACLTTGDVFSFAYNDSVYEIAVLEVRPDNDKHAIYTMETDLSVDFATPVGYVEPERQKPANKSQGSGLPAGGHLIPQGTMRQAINYDAIKPNGTAAAAGAAVAASRFGGGGQRLGSSRSNKTSGTGTPATTSTPPPPEVVAIPAKKGNGPQPLRLPPNTLFFGFDVIPLRKDRQKAESDIENQKPRFQGMGQTLRGKKVEPSAPEIASEPKRSAEGEQKLGRTLRDTPK